MKLLCTCLSIFLIAFPVFLCGQEKLTNDSIVKLVKAGLSDEVIIGVVKSQSSKFSLGAEDIIALKKAGVSDKVIAAMLNKSHGQASPAASSQQTNPSDSLTQSTFKEVGVYYKKAGEWMEVLPEVVNWKTGGVLKTIATAGIVKQDVNGHIPGPHSRNSVNLPAEFTIYTAEGVAITEYQLLRLRAQRDYREFRTITGGVLHQKSGAMRDMVPFEGKKVGNRLFSVILPSNLGAGEYGFLWLGASGAAGGLTSMSMGKMHTFRVVE